mmetsp:Transcript_27895/g.83597  ORF Transcript_27895/g.83597 Transcript_27895/m.83597 type:complete len:408 (-) Transcript_27895:53-1276(-)
MSLKEKADGLFRERKFVDAIDAYTEAIEADPQNKALYSNRAACREKLAANAWGDDKAAQIEAGLEDARKCAALDPAWVRGQQRVAAFCALAVTEEATRASKYPDFRQDMPVDRDVTLGRRKADDYDLRRSATAMAKATALRREAEAACRAGLAADAANEPLRLALQALRDSGFELDAALEPTDAALVDAAKAQEHKAAASKAFAAKDLKAAEAGFGKALAFDPTDAVLYSNRSACRAGQEVFDDALADADAALRLRPDWAKAHNRRATALYGIGNYVEAEAAVDAGLKLEPGNAALQALKKTCAIETAEPLAVQQQMASFRKEKRSNRKLQSMLQGLNLGGGASPQVFSPNQFNMSGGGGLGGMFQGANGGKGMSEDQMRKMARAMVAGGPAAPVFNAPAASPPAPP